MAPLLKLDGSAGVPAPREGAPMAIAGGGGGAAAATVVLGSLESTHLFRVSSYLKELGSPKFACFVPVPASDGVFLPKSPDIKPNIPFFSC